MKKLSLNLGQISSAEMLTREQMKNVMRGSFGGTGCKAGDDPVSFCSPSGCQYQCYVACVDSCGDYAGCASNWVC